MPPRPTVAIAAAIAAAIGPGLVARADPPRRGRIVTVEHTPLTDAPTRGPRAAPVTVEIYFSAGSELGNQAYRRAMALWRKHPARVRLVFRPLLRSDASQYVSRIAIAVHARGRFFEFMDDMVGRSGPQATPEVVLAAAVRAGLDRTTAAAILDPEARGEAQDDVEEVLRANDRRAAHARVGQRADLVLNGRPLGPTPDETTLESAYQQALAIARVERAAGAPADAVPALAARRARCADPGLRRVRRTAAGWRAGAAAAEDDVGDGPADAGLAPVAGWHLGALLRDGTGCAPEPPATGRVDRPTFEDLTRQPPTPALLTGPLSTAELPSCGPVDAPVVVQVICDLRNPSCTDQLVRARKVAIAYFPAVRLVYRPWASLDADRGPPELQAAEATMCSQRLGDGWTFVRAMLEQRRDDLHLEVAARRAGIDPDAFAACADAAPVAARRVIAEAQEAGVGWSPTVVIGQRAYPGGLTDERPMEDLIDAELAPGLLGAVTDAGEATVTAPGRNTCEAGR